MAMAATSSSSSLLLVFFAFLFFSFFGCAQPQQLPGWWEVLHQNAGIASMHTAVTHFGSVVLLDRTNIGSSRLPNAQCRRNSSAAGGTVDCTAHSALFDPSTRRIRPLTIITDTWCSSGQFLPDGTLLQTGGNLDGVRKLRTFSNDDWNELPSPLLSVGRWYATDQILPDGSIIIVGGSNAPSVEFYPPASRAIRSLPFLSNVQDGQTDNLYPYLHLLPDGHLFVFANNRSILYDPAAGSVLREYPPLQGGPRNYPSAGSSALLPLDPAAEGGYCRAEVVVCGGAQYGVFLRNETNATATTTCGRIVATDADAEWAIEEMPFPRVMGDMVMLPTGDVLIINGAQAGSQGFEMGSKPCLNPVLYRPDRPAGLRFMTLAPTVIPRMYHSTANLLPDGRVLVAGSNPHYFYKFDGDLPTELRLEAFSPEYLAADKANIRPTIEVAPGKIGYGQAFEVEIAVGLPVVGVVEVSLLSAPFATHSFSQGQRMVKLVVWAPAEVGWGVGVHRYVLRCIAPPDGKVAPPGYYMAFAVNQGVPSVARWLQLLNAPFVTHSFSQGQRMVKLVVSAPTEAEEESEASASMYMIGCTAPLDGKVAPPGYNMVFAVNLGVPSVAR